MAEDHSGFNDFTTSSGRRLSETSPTANGWWSSVPKPVTRLNLKMTEVAIWRSLNVYYQQESPPAWTQEAYCPACSKSLGGGGTYPGQGSTHLSWGWGGGVPTLARRGTYLGQGGYLPWLVKKSFRPRCLVQSLKIKMQIQCCLYCSVSQVEIVWDCKLLSGKLLIKFQLKY